MAGTRILCPVDFSDNSQAALETALTLARAQEGSLHLLHVVEPNSPMSAGQLTGPFTDLDMRELEGRLNDLLQNVGDVTVERYMEYGRPSHRIVEFANEHPIDLIVMGTHGRTGLAKLAMGGVAERVVRTADCAVLTVKQPLALLASGDESHS